MISWDSANSSRKYENINILAWIKKLNLNYACATFHSYYIYKSKVRVGVSANTNQNQNLRIGVSLGHTTL